MSLSVLTLQITLLMEPSALSNVQPARHCFGFGSFLHWAAHLLGLQTVAKVLDSQKVYITVILTEGVLWIHAFKGEINSGTLQTNAVICKMHDLLDWADFLYSWFCLHNTAGSITVGWSNRVCNNLPICNSFLTNNDLSLSNSCALLN